LVPDHQNFLNFLKLGGLCRPIESTQRNLFGKILKCSRDHKKIKSLAAGRRCETGTKEACELANTLKTTQHCSLKDLHTVLSITPCLTSVDFRHGSVQEDMTSGTPDDGASYHRPHKRDSSHQCGSAGVRRVVRRNRNCVSGFSKVGLLVIDFLTDSLVQVSNSGGNRKGCCCICSIIFTQAREDVGRRHSNTFINK
jgi:hypothetical protein